MQSRLFFYIFKKVFFLTCISLLICMDVASLAAPVPAPKSQAHSSYYVTTIAGAGVKGFQDGKAGSASFSWPTGVAIGQGGIIYVADYSNNLIRSVDAKGVVKTVAGSATAEPGFADGAGAEALLWGPDNIVLDPSGDIIVADADNFRIRRVTSLGVVTTVAGNGIMGLRDGKAGQAMFGYPTGIAVDSVGAFYVADRRGHAVRRISPEAIVTTIAGNGLPGHIDGSGFKSRLNQPVSVAVTPEGIVYIADSGNNAIRKIDLNGSITTIAGGVMGGYRDGTGSMAMFSWPTGIALDLAGNIFVCDSGNNKIRRITPGGVVSTIAGGLVEGSIDGPALSASFKFPTGIVVDKNGDIYVADSGNNKIRKIVYSQLWAAAATDVSGRGR